MEGRFLLWRPRKPSALSPTLRACVLIGEVQPNFSFSVMTLREKVLFSQSGSYGAAGNGVTAP